MPLGMCTHVFPVVCSLQSAEELERLTVDEHLQPIERAFYLLRFAARCVQKKTPTHVSLYISMENVRIFTKFSGNV